MVETSPAWERLLDYRQRLTGWMAGPVSLADTRLRVARLLDAGFGFGWDDLEADVETLGHRADFALRIDGQRWGVVLVRPMGSGTGAGAPPEAYVLADGAGLRWTWVTDGVALAVWHVGTDLVAQLVSALDLRHDSDEALQAVWERLCRDGIEQGHLESHRRRLLRPTVADVSAALLAPPVLAALRQTLLATFPEPGSDGDLAAVIRRLADSDDTEPGPGPMPPALVPSPAPVVAVPAPPPAAVEPASLAGSPAGEGPTAGSPTPPHVPDDGPAPRRRRTEPAADTLLTAMEKQRQTHERLRQNLQDLRDNRARLQDALVEMQRDYPDKLQRHAAARRQEPVATAAKSASWTLLGHLQAMGNGYWEWSAAEEGGQGVRLN